MTSNDSARARWVLAIVGLLAVNVIAMVVLAVLSARGASQVVPGYDQPARSALGHHAAARTP
ncbi:MAG: hypothetical protein H6Q90_2794 [Deltaproteobacteria bacterium]|nr:hypothetical protein [Deltaproteobacteria bacterium]